MIIAIIILTLFFLYSLCIVSSRCSRIEEYNEFMNKYKDSK